AKRLSKGRFKEEINLDIYLKNGNEEAPLLYVKVFYGRKPYYKPWVEFFGINDFINLGGRVFNYFDSIFEDKLLSHFSNSINLGESIYVEYYNDEETRRQLDANFPIPVSRLGYKLFNLGFSGFKNWYFPEGFMEGGIKLQGEKPMNNEVKNQQLREIYDKVETFLNRMENLNFYDSYIIKAVERAKNIINSIIIN
ncbi:MAG: DUF1122 family protein, partial [Nitrososphaerales archaeon]